ncbi:MAG: hypothetical protein DVB29_02640 [Verrucomicrobia bacterium]|nr:MAG: hypothetical protein DVB29_02640 [Verrucomicrobiota bacterium]
MSAQNLFSRIISSLPSFYPFTSKSNDNATVSSSGSLKQVSPNNSSGKVKETERSRLSFLGSWFGYTNRSYYNHHNGEQENDDREAIRSLAITKIKAIQIMDKELQKNSRSDRSPNNNLKKFHEEAIRIKVGIPNNSSAENLEKVKNEISRVALEAYQAFQEIKTREAEQVGQISSHSSNQEPPAFNEVAHSLSDAFEDIKNLDPQAREEMLEGTYVLAQSARENAHHLLKPFTDILCQEEDGFLLTDEENKILFQQEPPTEDQSRAIWKRFSQAIQAQFGDQLPQPFLQHEPNSPLGYRQAKAMIDDCYAGLDRVAELIPLQSGILSEHRENRVRCEAEEKFEKLSLEEQRCLKKLTETGKELLKTPGDLIKIGMLLKGYSVGPAVTTAVAHLGAPLATGALGTALLPVGALGIGIIAGVAAGWGVGYVTTYWDAKVDEALSPQSDVNALTGANAGANIAYHTTVGAMLGESIQNTLVGGVIDHAVAATGIPYSEALSHELFLLSGYYASEAALHGTGNDLTHDVVHLVDDTRHLLGMTSADNLPEIAHQAQDSVENEDQLNEEITSGVGFESRTFKIVNRVVTSASMPRQFTVYLSARYLNSKSRAEITYANKLESQSQSDGQLLYKPGPRVTTQELSYQNVLSDIKNHYQKLKNSSPSSDPIEPYVQERLAELKAIYCVMRHYEDHPEMQARVTRIACEAYQRVLNAKEKGGDPTGSSSGLYVINLYPYAGDIPYTVPAFP